MSDQQTGFLDDVSLQQTAFVASPTPNPYYRKEFIATNTVNGGVGGGYSYGLYLCLFIVVLVGIIAIIAITGLGRSTNNQHALNAYITQWHEMEEERNSHAEMASRMITLNDRKSTRSIILCGRQTYHKDNALANDTYKNLGTQSINEMRETQLKHHAYYHVNVRLLLTIKEGENKKETSQLTVLYNISSTLVPPFSTVRLEELEFNTRDHSIGPVRSIVLCSNNPDIDVQRCDESITKRKLFVLHGEDTVPLDIESLSPPSKIKQESTVTIDPESEKLRNLRMYNIVFYLSKVDDLQSETRILTIEPLQC